MTGMIQKRNLAAYCSCLVSAIADIVTQGINIVSVARHSQEVWLQECLDGDKTVCREGVLTCVLQEGSECFFRVLLQVRCGYPLLEGRNLYMVSKCQLSILLPEGNCATKSQLYSGPFMLRETASSSFGTGGIDSM